MNETAQEREARECIQRAVAGVPPKVEALEVGVQDQPRARLLARMAGNIAGGIEANPATLGLSADEVADRAEKIARALLARLGL